MTHTTAAQPSARPADSQDSGFLPRALASARRGIDWHTDDNGLCAACGSAYPCERAILAGPALSGLQAMATPMNRTAGLTQQASHGGRARRGRTGTGTVHRAAAPAATSSPGQSIAPVPVPPPPSDQGQAMPGHWPLRSFLELGALPGAVPCARLHTRQVTWEWGLAHLGHDTELLVSEILTNAVAAARAIEPVMPVRLWLLSDKIQIAIVVWDANPQPPVHTATSDDAESGRGLLLVEALSQRWGWHPAQATPGKVIWAALGPGT